MTNRLFYLLVILGFTIRGFHLGELIDSPHTWRQSDTANYIWEYYQHGIDLLEPAVCWMGGYKTLILEFPISQAAVSILYQVFGPLHIWARLFYLLAFGGSVWMLYLITRLLLSAEHARWTVLFYLFMPLSQFYSRAIHVDFSVIFLVLGMVYFYLLGIQREKNYYLLVGAIFCAFAFMTKAPYAAIMGLPLAWFIFSEHKWIFVIKRSPIFILPLIVYAFWQHYVFTMNAAAPDWEFLTGYRKFTHNAAWYYGSWEQRIEWANWKILAKRILFEVTGFLGIILAVVGLLSMKRNHRFLVIWLFSCCLYVFIFFNLNRVHNYYQIPFLPILAIWMSIGAHDLLFRISKRFQPVLLYSLIPLVAIENTLYAEKQYYQVQHLHLEIGSKIQSATHEEDLVIVNFENYDSKCPNFLYAARRNGWGLPEWGFTPEVVYRLMREGATYLASVRRIPLSKTNQNFLRSFSSDQFHLQEGYTLWLYDLDISLIWDQLPASEKKWLIEHKRVEEPIQ